MPRTRTMAHSPPLRFFWNLFPKWLRTMALPLLSKYSRCRALWSASVQAAIRPCSRKSLFCIPRRCSRQQALRTDQPHSRVAICNFRGVALLECYVVPTMAVTDYRTSTTGITPAHLSSRKCTVAITLNSQTHHSREAAAIKFTDVQRDVAELIKDKVIVGHSIWNDLSGTYYTFGIMFQDKTIATESNRRFVDLVLGVPHPAVNTRDVALYQPFRNALRTPNQLVRLPTLTFHLMGRRCQEGQQNPVRCTTNGERADTYICIGGLRQTVGKCARGTRPVPLTCQRMGECHS